MGFGASILVWLVLGVAPGDFASSTDPVAKQWVDLLNVPQPDPTRPDAAYNQYVFEKAVEFKTAMAASASVASTCSAPTASSWNTNKAASAKLPNKPKP